jgi:hypothetical protein
MLTRLLFFLFDIAISSIPCIIAYTRRCKDAGYIYALSLFFSCTIIGWFVAMAWALWGERNISETGDTQQPSA